VQIGRPSMLSPSQLRYANNSNYKNDEIITREVFVGPAVLEELKRIVEDSEVGKARAKRNGQMAALGLSRHHPPVCMHPHMGVLSTCVAPGTRPSPSPCLMGSLLHARRS
jgi:hypothetical protein